MVARVWSKSSWKQRSRHWKESPGEKVAGVEVVEVEGSRERRRKRGHLRPDQAGTVLYTEWGDPARSRLGWGPEL